jgi:hypothetical protein
LHVQGSHNIQGAIKLQEQEVAKWEYSVEILHYLSNDFDDLAGRFEGSLRRIDEDGWEVVSHSGLVSRFGKIGDEVLEWPVTVVSRRPRRG